MVDAVYTVIEGGKGEGWFVIIIECGNVCKQSGQIVLFWLVKLV